MINYKNILKGGIKMLISVPEVNIDNQLLAINIRAKTDVNKKGVRVKYTTPDGNNHDMSVAIKSEKLNMLKLSMSLNLIGVRDQIPFDVVLTISAKDISMIGTIRNSPVDYKGDLVSLLKEFC